MTKLCIEFAVDVKKGPPSFCQTYHPAPVCFGSSPRDSVRS